jgi:hypothetical protein
MSSKWRYTVAFTRTTARQSESWELPTTTLAEAEELAEAFVESGEADRAHVTGLYGPTDEEYSELGWTLNHSRVDG